jgi:hypothetical protein
MYHNWNSLPGVRPTFIYYIKQYNITTNTVQAAAIILSKTAKK